MRFLILILAFCFVLNAQAAGGFSGGGRGGGGFSSGGRSFSSSPSFSRPSTPAPRTTTTTTTTRSYSYSRGAAVGYGGMGYGYPMYGHDGLLMGMMIGNMMHPHNTVVYAGPGQYSNNALLYPDGRVVSQAGQQLGVYQNGSFVPMDNGPIVAQPVPQQPQTVVIKEESKVADFLSALFICLLIAVVVIFIFMVILT